MKNRLVTKIIIAYIGLAALAAPVLWYFVSGAIEGYFTDTLAENLRSQAAIISVELPELGSGPKLDPLARKYKALTGARVTIINADGRVLGDSDDDSTKMENHLGRPEVLEAAKGRWGRSIRHSHTLKMDMLYVSLPVGPDGGANGFIRLSMPLRQVEAAMSSIKERVATGAFVVFLAAIILGMYLSKLMAGKIGRMAAFTKAVAAGDFSRRLRANSGDEFGALAANLNEMAGQLHDKIDALSVEKAMFEAVLGGMVEGVLVADKDGRVALANRSLREIFGIDKEYALGRPFLEVIRNSELSGIIKKAHDKKDVVTGEVDLLFSDNLYLFASCVPLALKGGFGGSVLVLHDITRLKALERVRRDFVANVTHELKTPIAAIQGFAETLLSGALEDRDNARRFLGIIESNSRRLTRLIEDLLTLSRIELGEVSLTFRAVSVENVVREAVALLEPRVRAKRIELTTDIPEDTPRIMADRDRLFQIALNILDNAVKFTPEGGRVTISGRAAGEDGMVKLKITDTGPGIPPDLLPRIGERFFRVDAARSRELGGTGLGIAIVRRLVNAHGGSFSIESPPRKGTVVTLTFRAAKNQP